MIRERSVRTPRQSRLVFILMHAWLAWPKVDAFQQRGLRVGDLEPHVVCHWPVAPRGRCCRGMSRRITSSHISPRRLDPCPVQLGVGVAKTMLDVLHLVHTIGHRRLGSWRVCCGDLTRRCRRKELWNTRLKLRGCSAFWMSLTGGNPGKCFFLTACCPGTRFCGGGVKLRVKKHLVFAPCA